MSIYLQGQRSPPNAVWPHPQQIKASADLLYVRPNDLSIYSNLLAGCDIIQKALERYKPLFFPPTLEMRPPPSGNQNILESLTLTIRSAPRCDQHIDLTSDEACE